MEAEEDERREAAIASAELLQPDFKPAKTGITHSQLEKFQELHRRRLQIKAKSMMKNKPKGKVQGSGNFNGKDSRVDDYAVDESRNLNEDSGSSVTRGIFGTSSQQQDNVTAQSASKKRQKLHWGLDTKERWERKSNM